MAILSLQNISFSYDKTPVLKDLSYEFEKGKIYCIIGKSGAGKTTLLSLLSGLAKSTAGDIFYDGISEYELATMFFEGNSYALTNIRSLIAMGVSYNEDGKTYLDKVKEAAVAMNQNANVFDGEDYDDLAETIALAVSATSFAY